MGERRYTFHVYCTFRTQYTFMGHEVERDPDSGEGSFEPTDAALKAVESALTEYLGNNYAVDRLEVSTDSDLLLGIADAPG